LKPEKCSPTEVGEQPPCPKTRRRIYVRSLELNSNDFSRLARSTLLSKIRSISALGGRFRIRTTRILRFEPSSSKPFKHTTRFPVLSTREPYSLPREHRHSTPQNLRSKTRNMPLWICLSTTFSAHKGTRAYQLD